MSEKFLEQFSSIICLEPTPRFLDSRKGIDERSPHSTPFSSVPGAKSSVDFLLDFTPKTEDIPEWKKNNQEYLCETHEKWEIMTPEEEAATNKKFASLRGGVSLSVEDFFLPGQVPLEFCSKDVISSSTADDSESSKVNSHHGPSKESILHSNRSPIYGHKAHLNFRSPLPIYKESVDNRKSFAETIQRLFGANSSSLSLNSSSFLILLSYHQHLTLHLHFTLETLPGPSKTVIRYMSLTDMMNQMPKQEHVTLPNIPWSWMPILCDWAFQARMLRRQMSPLGVYIERPDAVVANIMDELLKSNYKVLKDMPCVSRRCGFNVPKHEPRSARSPESCQEPITHRLHSYHWPSKNVTLYLCQDYYEIHAPSPTRAKGKSGKQPHVVVCFEKLTFWSSVCTLLMSLSDFSKEKVSKSSYLQASRPSPAQTTQRNVDSYPAPSPYVIKSDFSGIETSKKSEKQFNLPHSANTILSLPYAVNMTQVPNAFSAAVSPSERMTSSSYTAVKASDSTAHSPFPTIKRLLRKLAE